MKSEINAKTLTCVTWKTCDKFVGKPGVNPIINIVLKFVDDAPLHLKSELILYSLKDVTNKLEWLWAFYKYDL